MNISAITTLSPAANISRADDVPSSSEAKATSDRKKVSQQFEAILVRQLLGKTMTSMMGSSAKDSTAGSVYGDMVTDSLAQQLTAGPGLGLGRMIEKQLTPRGTPVAEEAKPSQP